MCLPPEARAARAEQATHFNDCRVICSYIDAATGERCEASGTIDPQLEYRLHGVLYGLSVTWDAQYRTGEYGSRGLRGPTAARDGATVDDEDADEWRWAFPRADSELQRRANEVGAAGQRPRRNE